MIAKAYFNIKLFIAIFFAFVFFTVIGTLSHEGGHFIAGKALGYNASLHYGYTDFGENSTGRALQEYYDRWGDTGMVDADTARQKSFALLLEKQRQENKWIILGGPLQTMVTGTIGFILLIIYRKKIVRKSSLNIRQWLLIFLSLFWLRQVANAATGLFIKKPVIGMEGMIADEIKLAVYYKMPYMSILFGTAVIGLILSVLVIFIFIPARERLTFIAAGFFGGIAGFIGWFFFAGPWLMP